MSNIDKRALLGADKHANQHRLSRLIIEANNAELRAIAEAAEQYTDQLIAALEAEEKRIAEQREYYEGVIADGSKRIAELERSETQLINERDYAESALADMYQAATGERPEWSNMFGFANAVDVVEERLATLEANQSQTTPTGIQLITEAIGAHGYIVGCLLQGRPDLALEESRKWVSAFGQAAEIVSAQDADDIKVKGE
ncbi:ead/Ea22-like family protein [Salmonella enterica subsp. enterica serovar Abony]|uniref:Ead/Ea22-like family protein n=1 Tax=Salmonella enterica TaxID=28901 RepID=A0A747EUS3_SALER|nr:ead/Ea22-like family protein [Salmonella enterica]ECQ6338583.1 ead/Ea22-like family protein [Salmonella enterica subsp. enterica serovar Abony]EDY6217787.1 ead/Ea22-like family protein [Salmonella enterica]EGB5720034.1 ead/Ea22-like family protein [Salmonella enterica subsp. enterica serovar Abony]EGP3080710.1 ead/Ea22-like family protein [Salmonella enterica subsp. enterica serovar Abony]